MRLSRSFLFYAFCLSLAVHALVLSLFVIVFRSKKEQKKPLAIFIGSILREEELSKKKASKKIRPEKLSASLTVDQDLSLKPSLVKDLYRAEKKPTFDQNDQKNISIKESKKWPTGKEWTDIFPKQRLPLGNNGPSVKPPQPLTLDESHP